MIRSFGVIPIIKRTQGIEVLMVQHRQGHWSFPKGHAEAEETEHQTARRELQEETGLQIVEWLPMEPVIEEYDMDQGPKRVTYFLAWVKGSIVVQIEELSAYRWVSLQEAQQLATFPATQQLVHAISARLSLLA